MRGRRLSYGVHDHDREAVQMIGGQAVLPTQDLICRVA